ncbi:hypothetical protein NDU88_005851 [Pleurodeles waltl]|uniref:Uncharacterized protein n=1 Tax=Pleurodeles waltl TaxID=8319 RepID=A0AAV7N0K5_PLEWA|nr:hypothetical protein NDU88_005851 [Pleurodeles waltl]
MCSGVWCQFCLCSEFPEFGSKGLSQTIKRVGNSLPTSAARKQLKALDMNKVEYALLGTKQRYYVEENKVGRLLAHCPRAQAVDHRVQELTGSDGTPLCHDEEVALKFEHFYAALNTAGDLRNKDITAYLSAALLPTIPQANAPSLERDITPNEVLLAIQCLQPGKAPGHDVYSAEFYKTFGLVLDPLMVLELVVR